MMKIYPNYPLMAGFGLAAMAAIFVIAWLSFNKKQKEAVTGTYVNVAPQPAKTKQLRGHFTDPRDGQRYRTIELFGQTWMAQNLNYETNDYSSWCYNDDPAQCEKFGRLYTWKSAQRACPDGWRLPKARDWNEVYIRLGHVENCYEALVDGGYMGFDAKMAGWRSQALTYEHAGKRAYFWSSTLVDYAYARYYRLDTNKKKLSSDNAYKELAFSCRCVKELN